VTQINKFLWVFGACSVLVGIYPAHAQQVNGTKSTGLLRSSFPFVDRAEFLDRGRIQYRVPAEQEDGLPVSDARTMADVEPLIVWLNQVEGQNQDFRVGKGRPRKRAGQDRHSPQITGCIDSVLIAKNGKLVLEEYFADARIDKPHYQMSVTKSILAYAIGIAIEQGKIGSVEDRLVDHLPGLDLAVLPDGVEQLTLHDLLTMKSGLRVDKTMARQPMERAEFAQKVLTSTEPIPAHKPYKYDGLNCELLTHVLYNATGQTLGQFAEEHLFGPLGITDFSFGPSSSGLDKGAAGMRLRSRDMLKIGLLTAAGGQWQGAQVLSNDWIERATAVQVNREKPTQYGYYWWSHEVEHGGRTYRVRSCRGAGGQFIMVLPELQLVAVFTSYYADNKPIQHFERVILPAFAQD